MIRLKNESGQALVISALCFSLLLGFTAFAADVGVLFVAKRKLQTAADSGAIAGALDASYGNAVASAQADTSRNGFTNGLNGATVTVNTPPQYGAYKACTNCVEVVVAQNQPTTFMRVFHHDAVNVAARSVARVGGGTNCVYTLNTAGTGIQMSGNDTLSMPNCSIVDNSSSSSALSASGSNTITAKAIGVVGGLQQTGYNALTPTPVMGITPVSDPLSSLVPPAYSAASCQADPKITGNSCRGLGPAQPGGTVCYNGLTISGNNAVTLDPGVYVINGALTMNGSNTVTGTGVTFYFPNSSASFADNGSDALNLSAPTSGTYNGVLFYQDPSDRNAMVFNETTNSNVQGIFYLPTANLTLNGAVNASMDAALVVGSLTFHGNAALSNYASVNPGSPLTSARLVE